MAQPFLTPIDLNKNEIQNARIQNLAAAPGSPVAGLIYWDTVLVTFRIYNGSAWVNVGDLDAATILSRLLTVDGAGSGLDADLLDGQSGSYYLARGNHSGTQTSATISDFDEAAQDAIGLMVSGNTESGITVAYDDTNAKLNFTVTDSPTVQGASAAQLRDRATHSGTQTAATISDFDTAVRANRLDQMAAPTSAVGMGAQRITNVADPTGAQDAATKAYVDATAQGLDFKQSVRAATTANLAALSGTLTVDGVALVNGDRVLVKNQTTQTQNGIYIVSSGAWTRAADFDSSADASPGSFVFVEEGTTQADTSWVLSTNGPITLNTTNLTFTQFGAAQSFIAGAGLTLTGNTFDIGAGTGITVNADSIQIANGGVGTTQLADGGVTLAKHAANSVDASKIVDGSVGNAELAASAVDNSKVAAGAAIARSKLDFGAGLVNADIATAAAIDVAKINGAVRKVAASVGDASATSYVVTHNLGTRDVVTVLFQNAAPYAEVHADVEHTDNNTVTVRFAVAPTANQYRVVVAA